jgi:uncharacterized protein Usg
VRFVGRLFLCGLMVFALVRAAAAGPATAQLVINGATCSGTIVAPSAILSAAHCFREEVDPILEMFGLAAPPKPLPTEMTVDGYKVYIETITFDEADHALVRVIFVFKDYATLTHQLPAVGDKVHYWGNASKLNNTYREGYVTSYLHGDMLMDLNGFFGDSGAGIFDESGKVVGVVSYLNYSRHDGLGFKLMGAYPLEFTPLQYSMMGVPAP